MEFNGLKCPVCDVQFKDGDDIVVCPECGTPHHRACWEVENHCAYEDKHGENFEYEKENANESDVIICSKCGTENFKGAFYCSKCGNPINVTKTEQSSQPQGDFQNPFASAFDPMAGVNPEEDMGGVTAGELAKFVGNNTQYFMRVFSRIKTFGKGRFNLCGFLFSGFYLLYRKMYKLGAIIAAAIILLLIAETYISYTPAFKAFYSAIEQASVNSAGIFSRYSNLMNAYASLDFNNQIIILLWSMCSSLALGIQIIVGIFANRWYFRHCRNQIKSIKENGDNTNLQIESKGGVNLAIAISIGAIYAAVYFIPNFIF